MKISSSIVEFSSTHYLGTQESEAVALSGKGFSLSQQSLHAEEQTDVAYEVQLSGLAAQQTGAPTVGGIVHKKSEESLPVGDSSSDIEAISAAELAKLSPEDRQKVELIQNYVSLLTGGAYKVVLGSGEQAADANTASGNTELLSANRHSVKIIDMVSGNAAIDLSALSLDPARGIVGVISEQSQTTAVGNNMFVLGQDNVSPTQAWEEFRKTNTEAGLVTHGGDTTVFIPFSNPNGSSSGLGVGTKYSAVQTNTEEEYTAWTEKGTITTADGRVIEIDKTSLMYRTAETTTTEAAVTIDPLVIQYRSASGHVELTDEKYNFDLNSDGQTDSISFVQPGAGFLAVDQNNDGKINDGSELFGTKNGDGFGDLAKYDSDNNGWIDENDAIYSKLNIWSKDEQGNDQMLSLKQAGVGAIYLGSTSTEFTLKDEANQTQGQIRRSGFYLHEDGTAGTVQQVDLVAGAAIASQPVQDGTAINSPASNPASISTTETAWQSVYTESQTQAVFADGYTGTLVPEQDGNIMVVRRTAEPRPPVVLQPVGSIIANSGIDYSPTRIIANTDESADDSQADQPQSTQKTVPIVNPSPTDNTVNPFFKPYMDTEQTLRSDLIRLSEQFVESYRKQVLEAAKQKKKAEHLHSSLYIELQEQQLRLHNLNISNWKSIRIMEFHKHVNIML
ncbi:MAG: hypothetical protein H6Q72_2053 [Firmicutes bacterium]|nr:hypothetical protein [Bacillota bacterium]